MNHAEPVEHLAEIFGGTGKVFQRIEAIGHA